MVPPLRCAAAPILLAVTIISTLFLSLIQPAAAATSFFGFDEKDTMTNFCCQSCGREAKELNSSVQCCCARPGDTDWTVRQGDFLCRVLREFAWKYYDPATYGEPAGSYLGVLSISIIIREFRLDALTDIEVCEVGGIMALLLSAEHASNSIWPLIQSKEDFDTLAPTFQLAREYYFLALTKRNKLNALDPARYQHIEDEWPLRQAMLTVSSIFHSLDSRVYDSGVFMNVDPYDYRFAHLLGSFSDLVVHPTKAKEPIYNPAATLAEEPVATPAQRAQAFQQVVSVFQDLGVDYVPMKGTLIGLLRYGSTVGELPGYRQDVVDIDFDFWVNVPYDQRIPFSSKLFTRLEKFGWTRCSLDGDHPFHVEPYRGNRLLNLNCNRFEPYWIRLDILFFEFFGEGELVAAKACDTREITPQDWISAYDNVLKQNCSIAPEKPWKPAAYRGTPGRLPKSLIYPLKTCLGFGLDVPCPSRPLDFLYETFLELSGAQTSCLAFPSITATRSCELVHYWLVAGWTLKDDVSIRTQTQTLDSKGYESFASLLNSSQCRKPVEKCSFRKRWFTHCLDLWPDEIREQKGLQILLK